MWAGRSADIIAAGAHACKVTRARSHCDDENSDLMVRSMPSACEGTRLEPWQPARCPRPWFETAAARPPHHEGGLLAAEDLEHIGDVGEFLPARRRGARHVIEDLAVLDAVI